jgi:UDP-N-acetylmuramyl pentapeptide synthase
MGDLRRLDLEKITGGRWAVSPPLRPIGGAHFDSRRLSAGDLFVAVDGPSGNSGHRYLAHALEKGASAALVREKNERVPLAQLVVPEVLPALRSIAEAHRRGVSGEIIAITGSYGKTTTKNLLALLLGEDRTFATEGNQNGQLGVPISVLNMDPERCRYGVLEVGIEEPGDMGRLTNVVRAKHVLFTGISHKHGEFFPCKRALFWEKLRLTDHVVEQGGKFVVGPELRKNPALRRLRDCTIVAGRGDWNFPLPVDSDGFARDFALCLAICDHLGIPRRDIRERIGRWKAPELRGQIFRHRFRDQIFYVDCYNSDLPALLNSARNFLSLFPRRNHLFVIGGMSGFGVHSEKLHAIAGNRFPFFDGDAFFLVGEETRPLLEGLRRRGLTRDRWSIFPGKGEDLAKRIDGHSGVIYLKGSRCHALETLVNLDDCVLLD